MEKFNFYWSTLLKNIEWIKFSETKAVFLVTVYSVILTIIYANAKDVYNVIAQSNWLLFCSIVSALASLLSIFFCFRTLSPVLKNQNPDSIIYFGHIQEKFNSSADYFSRSSLILNDETQTTEQAAEQVFATSKIAWRKFSSVSWAIRLFLTSIGFLTLQISLYLFVI